MYPSSSSSLNLTLESPIEYDIYAPRGLKLKFSAAYLFGRMDLPEFPALQPATRVS
jgi:hypothetical protein